MAEVASMVERATTADGYRRAILLHLTSWAQDVTGVVTDPKATASEALEQALNEVNRAVYEIEGKTYRKPLGLEAGQLLMAAELVMRRAAHYAGRGDEHAEGQSLQAALTMVEEAGWYFADLAKECSECEKSHLSAGIFCRVCREPFRSNMPAEARWFITREEGMWVLRNGVGAETLIFAYDMELGPEEVQAAQEWAASVLKADYDLPVYDWSPSWNDPQAVGPDCWIAATNTD